MSSLSKSKNKVIAGVCAGIAEHFNWDPVVVRLVYAVLTIGTAFSGVLIYIILALVMPER